VGDTKVIPIAVRVLVASNVPLVEEIARGRIRKDLFYRLNVLDIAIPPLRERAEDIPVLFASFVAACANRNGESSPPIPQSLLDVLEAYEWPGNVRELENVAEKYSVLSRLMDSHEAVALISAPLRPAETSCPDTAASFEGSLADIERRAVRAVFDEEGGNLSRTAKRLAVDRQTVRKRLGEGEE